MDEIIVVSGLTLKLQTRSKSRSRDVYALAYIK